MNEQHSVRRPLDGVRVVSFEQAVAAPLCTRLLRDLGAEVIKIERTDGGDFARGWDHAAGGFSSYFMWLNRGKRSVAINGRAPESQELLRRLIAYADVFVENASIATVTRLGLTYRQLSAGNRRLVHCSISGYGQDGPYGNRKAYDLLVQAETGVIALTGTDEEPAKVGIPVADIAAGMYAVQGILAALLEREHSGVGMPIDISMFDAMVDWLGGPLTGVANGGQPPRRTGLHHNMIVPYGPYRARDGKWLCFAVEHEREWESFCENVLRDPSLLGDPRFHGNDSRLQNRTDLETAVQRAFLDLDAAAWQDRLEAAGIAYSNLNDVRALVSHPQLVHRGLLEPVDVGDLGSVLTTAPALRLNGYSPAGRPPHVGEDTRQVLEEFGYTPDEVERLRKAGAVN